MLLHVACGRDATELVAELPQLTHHLLTADEATRGQACGALRGVPGAEVLDHRLRVHRRLGVGRELAHRRRAPESHRGRLELGENLVVRVAAA